MFLRVDESERSHYSILGSEDRLKKPTILFAVAVNEGCEGQLHTPSFMKCPHGSH